MCFILILLLLNQTFKNPLFQAEYSHMFADDLSYHQKSIKIADIIEQRGYREGYDLAAFYYPVNVGYCYASAVLYHWFPDLNTLVIRMLNCLFSSLSAVLTFLIAYLVYSDFKIARWAGILSALFPVSIVLASVQYKDTVVIFLFLMSILILLNLFNRLTLTTAVLLFLSLGLLMTIRIALVAVLFIVGIIYYFSQHGMRKSLLLFGVSLGCLFLITRSFYQIEGLLHVYSFPFLKEIGQRVAQRYLTAVSDQNSLAFMMNQQHSFLLLLLFHALLFIVGPLPNSQLGIFTAILPGVWIWYLLLPAVFSGIYYSVRHKIKYSGFLILLCIVVFLMTVFSLNGSNFRYRQQIMPLFLIFASTGILHTKSIKAVYYPYLFAGVLIASLYLLIKYA
jgi:4-amino-4-deoxy-L-arabinose transferase-like glycosyltransferase